MLQSLRLKAIASLLVSAVLVAALAGTALWSASALTTMSAAKSQMAQVLQRHMQADMMHDALRGDLLAALQAAPDDGAAHQAAEKDVTEHAEEFRSDIKANRAAQLPPAIARMTSQRARLSVSTACSWVASTSAMIASLAAAMASSSSLKISVKWPISRCTAARSVRACGTSRVTSWT